MIVLAHGGTAGAIAEMVFLALPVLLFFLLSKVSKRKAERARDAEAQGPGGSSGGRPGEKEAGP